MSTAALQKLFSGVDILQGKSNATVTTSSLGPPQHTYIFLYFSAHWCPPCRRFTPHLAKAYKDLREGRQDFEMVFVSCDSSAEEFVDYAKDIPFPAVPFLKKKERTRMMRKYKVRSLPTLVLIDGEGKMLNKNCVADVREENSLDKFPWKERTILDALSDAAFTRKNGTVVKREQLEKMSSFAIYYAAQWSPPCRAFTPQLISIYQQLKDNVSTADTEFIFVSVDSNADAFQEFYDDMPWAKVEFQHPATKEIAKILELSTLPTLITLKGDGTIINRHARQEAADDLGAERFPWAPLPLPAVVELQPSERVVNALNENCCFILHLNGSSNAQTQLAEFKSAGEELVPAHNGAASTAADDSLKINFFVTPENSSDLLMRVVSIVQAQLPPAGKAFVLCMSLVGERMKEVFFGDLNKDSITAVAKRFIKKVTEDAASE